MTMHPSAQFERENWISLNGEWKFSIKGKAEVANKIIVPFCPESKLSGVEYTDFINECVYEKAFTRPKMQEDERLILHFGAVDYEAKVFVNNKYIGKHTGGYTPFSFDITDFAVEGENTVTVEVYDDVKESVPSGKQSPKKESYGCFYTRCTGIWQTVWLEVVPQNRITAVKYFPHIDDTSVDMEIVTTDEGELEVFVSYEGKQVGYTKQLVQCKALIHLPLKEKHLWEVGNGRLYEVVMRYGKDEVKSYFGLREVKFDGMKFLLNGKSVFQRFVLDQGYYADGVYTPKDESVIENDIRSALQLGFNGIRLHQKVFDPTYLYYCDKLGCMAWGEFPSWGIPYDGVSALGVFTKEWIEAVERDFNHPSIISWCPLNEVWKNIQDARKSRDVRFIDAVYEITKQLDNTRPCVDVSGGFHGHKTDLYDFHCYEEYEKVEGYLERLEKDDCLEVPLLYDEKEPQLRYRAEIPTNISEYGGFRFSQSESVTQVNTVNECGVDCTESWGYGKGETDEKSFVERYCKLTKLLLRHPKLSGFCYTQLYDIEQEQNGFFTYERVPKLSAQAEIKIAECNRTLAEIEK